MADDEDRIGRVLLFIWRVGVQGFYALVTIAIFASIHTDLATLITAYAGILYATIRTCALGLNIYNIGIFPKIFIQTDRILAAINSRESEIDLEELETETKKMQIKLWIEAGGLSLIYFICLFEVLMATGRGSL